MSTTGAWFTSHVEKLEAWAKELLKHDDPAVKAVGEDVEKTAAELKGDADQVEREAAADAEKVATDAEDAAKPVAEEAVKAAETVSAEAVADIAKSV